MTTRRIPEPEKSFLQAVRELARALGYREFHPHDSRRSTPGFPDLVCVKAGYPVLYIELKSERGRLTAEQQGWLETLRQAQGTRVYVWRPSDWNFIVEVLKGERS